MGAELFHGLRTGGRRRVGGLVLVAAGVAGVAGSGGRAGAAVLVQDNFDTVASGSGLSGRVPVASSTGNAWSAAAGPSITGNGAGGLSANTGVPQSSNLDLGAGYLAANPGTYDLSVQFTQPTGVNSQSWVATGFAPGGDASVNLVGNNGGPWVLYRANGNVNVYGGPNTTNLLPPGASATSTAALGSVHTFRLVLDTAPAAWTLNAFVDGTQLDLNGASTAGNAFAYTTNPTTDRYLALSTGVNGTASTATIDNLSLTGPVPEPGTAAVATVAGAGLLAARRRTRRG